MGGDKRSIVIGRPAYTHHDLSSSTSRLPSNSLLMNILDSLKSKRSTERDYASYQWRSDRRRCRDLGLTVRSRRCAGHFMDIRFDSPFVLAPDKDSLFYPQRCRTSSCQDHRLSYCCESLRAKWLLAYPTCDPPTDEATCQGLFLCNTRTLACNMAFNCSFTW